MSTVVAESARAAPPSTPALRLLAKRRCRQTQWRYVRLNHLLVLPPSSRSHCDDRWAVVRVVRGSGGPWALRVVASDDNTALGSETPAEFPLSHPVWRVLDRTDQPAIVDPAELAATHPTIGVNAVVRYHGDLTDRHGIYWLILADDPNELVLRDDAGTFLRARASSLDVLA